MTDNAFEQQYMARLNPQQREAVRAVDGAFLLLAVPGSGKTTTLITRLGYMTRCREINPGQILTITYTRAATAEMRTRYEALFGSSGGMTFSTINALSLDIVRYYSANYGKSEMFQIAEDRELIRLIGQLYREIQGEYATEGVVRDVQTLITYCKNMMLSKSEIEGLNTDIQKFPEMMESYQRELHKRRWMDFDDQMSYALTILRKFSGVLEFFQEKYRYISMDEAQDTSKIQHVIVEMLARKYGNLFMVGDEDQSIYGFRAAYPEALTGFEQNHPGGKVLFMEQNYRSTPEIVETAGAFVAKNRFRYNKTMVPVRPSGQAVRIIRLKKREDQYRYLCALAERGTEVSAVLFRNNESILPLVDLLEQKGIDYNYRSAEVSFFTHRLVKDVLDIIYFAQNPTDSEVFMRIYYKFNVPVSKEAARLACHAGARSGAPLMDELSECPKLPAYAQESVMELAGMLRQIPDSTAEKALNLIWSGLGYSDYLRKHRMDSGKFDLLRVMAKQVQRAGDFSAHLEELRQAILRHRNSFRARMILSTIHASKGLEYERLYLLDAFDGILPSGLPGEKASPEEIREYEEERRLYYVAITRAKDELYLFQTNRSSSFVEETMRTLPGEVWDTKDVFTPLRAKLIGKTHTDVLRGKGTVIAQNGPYCLTEFADGNCLLLSLEEMLHRSAAKPDYEKPSPVSRKGLPGPDSDAGGGKVKSGQSGVTEAAAGSERSERSETGKVKARNKSKTQNRQRTGQTEGTQDKGYLPQGQQTNSEQQGSRTEEFPGEDESQSAETQTEPAEPVPERTEEECRQIAALASPGVRAVHIAIGEGTVMEVNDKLISIRFDKRGDTRTFDLNMCLKKGLLSFKPKASAGKQEN